MSAAVPVPADVRAFAAPAKLNLDLRIVGRRADGYHLLESIFVLTALQDTVWLRCRDDGEIVLHTPAPGVAAEQDLAYRAAVLLKNLSGSLYGADIWLEKRIPMGGGLGGGSSDAATVLMGLNRLWQCGLTQEALMQSGVGLGADVPFFIFGRNAFVRGIGEQLQALEVPQQWYVIVKPPVDVSTAVIFAHKDLTRNSEPCIMPDFQAQHCRNDMQAVVLREYPEVEAAYAALAHHGTPMMTGSGACVFLRFDSENQAQAVYRQISSAHQAYCTHTLTVYPFYG